MVQTDLRTCCTERKKVIQACKNPTVGNDFNEFLRVTGKISERLQMISDLGMRDYAEFKSYTIF